MEHLSYLKKLNNEILNNEYYDSKKEKIENSALNNKILLNFLFCNFVIFLVFVLVSNVFSPILISWFFLFLSSFILINRDVSNYITKLERFIIVSFYSLLLSILTILFLCGVFFLFQSFDYFKVNELILYSFCGLIVSLSIYFYDINEYKKEKKEFESKEKQNYEYSNKIDDKKIEEIDLMISIANVNELDCASDFLSNELDYLLEEDGFNSYDEYFISINNRDNELNIENY